MAPWTSIPVASLLCDDKEPRVAGGIKYAITAFLARFHEPWVPAPRIESTAFPGHEAFTNGSRGMGMLTSGPGVLPVANTQAYVELNYYGDPSYASTEVTMVDAPGLSDDDGRESPPDYRPRSSPPRPAEEQGPASSSQHQAKSLPVIQSPVYAPVSPHYRPWSNPSQPAGEPSEQQGPALSSHQAKSSPVIRSPVYIPVSPHYWPRTPQPLSHLSEQQGPASSPHQAKSPVYIPVSPHYWPCTPQPLSHLSEPVPTDSRLEASPPQKPGPSNEETRPQKTQKKCRKRRGPRSASRIRYYESLVVKYREEREASRREEQA